MRASLPWLFALALPLAGLPVRAHGPPLAIFDVLSWEDSAPRIVRLLRGAAVRDELGLRFVCQTRWGGLPEAPRMVGVGPRALLAAEGGFVWLEPDGTVTSEPAMEGLKPSALRALEGREGQVAGLFREDTGASLWQLAPGSPRRIHEFVEAPNTAVMQHDGAWLTAREAAGELTISQVTLGSSGQAVAEVLMTTRWPATPELVWLGDEGGLWLRGREASGHRLDRVDLAEGALVNVARTSDPFYGPVLVPGRGVFVVVGGALARVSGDALVPIIADETPRLFCLRAAPAPHELLACDATDLLRLDPETGAAQPLLALRDLLPPSLEGLDPTLRLVCNEDWRDAAQDAGIPVADSDATEPDAPEPDAPEPDAPEPDTAAPNAAPAPRGCSVGPSSLGALLGLCALATTLRRRACRFSDLP